MLLLLLLLLHHHHRPSLLSYIRPTCHDCDVTHYKACGMQHSDDKSNERVKNLQQRPAFNAHEATSKADKMKEKQFFHISA
jgi:hypothetical protein